jgi:uncharacterized phage-like protein YoqJ
VGFDAKWRIEDRVRYEYLLGRAYERHFVCDPGYAPHKMNRRNHWMVDHANKVKALWSGSAGGTANCVRYAEERRVPVDNVWERWRSF